MKKERMRIEGLRKGSMLKRIHLQIFEGEATHCIFDNLQEKELFLKILAGRELPDAGRLYYEERMVPEQKARDVLKERVAVIDRESCLIGSVTIAENLFLVRPFVKGCWVRKHANRKEARRVFEELGIGIDADKPVSELTAFEKVQVEIAKAYLLRKQILVLTAIGNALGDAEKQRLRQLLEKMRMKKLSCIVVEPLEDIDFVYTDSVAIVKHGKTCLERPVGDCDYVMLHTILYRDEMEKRIDERQFTSGREMGEEAVVIRDLSAGPLKRLSIRAGRGEIVKLFCADEPSYEAVTKLFRGGLPIDEGRICIRGVQKELRNLTKGLADRIGVVEGNPAMASLFPELSAMDNLMMLLSQKINGIWTIPKYKKSIRLLLKEIVGDEVFTKEVKDLSPADIQRIVYCRWLIYSPALLVCIQPFAEGDIQARETAREMLYILQERGIPLLIITSNTTELNYCRGREIYIRHGRMIQKEEAYKFLSIHG